jgi:capsular exopolysaccharide synthesis family protein
MGEQTLRDYMKVIFRQKWVILLTILIVNAAVYVRLLLKTPQYEATTKMLVSAQKVVEAPYYSQFGGSQVMPAVNTQAEIVKSNPVLDRALKVIGVKTMDYEKRFAHPLRKRLIDQKIAKQQEAFQRLNISETQKDAYLYRNALEDLRNNIDVKPIKDTNMFTISYRDFNPLTAAAVANIVSRSYVIFDLEQQLAELKIKYGEKNLAVTQLSDSITRMTNNLSGTPLSDVEAIGPASVKIIEQALSPVSRFGPSDSRTKMLALFVSIFLGVTLAFLFDYLDQKFRSPHEIEQELNIPCLGYVPRTSSLSYYRKIGENVVYEMKAKKAKTLLLTSALPKEGVSMLTAQLAKTIAHRSKFRVLAIDSHLKKPGLHKYFKVNNRKGLSDVVKGELELNDVIIKLNDYLFFLPAGRDRVSHENLFESPLMKMVLKSAAQEFDFILIDGENLRDVKDSTLWSSHVNAILMIINSSKTRRQTLKYELASMNGMRSTVVGAVLNKRRFPIPSLIYHRI